MEIEEIMRISKFIEDAEEFKKSSKYDSMPSDLRDFFNEELGKFKLFLDILKIEEKGASDGR